jgi:DNA-binding NtrC family response regulator
MTKILIIEDEVLLGKSLSRYLKKAGYNPKLFRRGKKALQAFKKETFDFILLDNRLPDGEGINLIPEILSLSSDIPIIVMTAYASVDNAVKAMKRGAVDYIVKPLNLEELQLLIEKNIKNIKMKERLEYQKDKQANLFDFSHIIGSSSAIEKIKDIVKKLIEAEYKTEEKPSTVLIQGETGTGKELIAKALHYNGKRKEKEFVEINCTAMPKDLIEAELFGYEKGAFTNADKQKKGLMEIASGGSLFLDEIGYLSLDLQLKLLKVIEENKIRRLGGTEDILTDTRIITATNRDLKKAVEDKSFREDLYYRLNVINICLPPLRERKKDIMLLAEYYLEFYKKKFGKDIKDLSEEAKKIFMVYDWPGNIRELKNTLERAVFLEKIEYITEDSLGLPTSGFSGENDNLFSKIDSLGQGIKLDGLEKKLVMEALEKAKGNQTKAADLLGISRDTLRYRLKKYGIK